jgi:2-amino-4-hydroxy-6-hydroxymethyldihydropteridine diphosphokinase
VLDVAYIALGSNVGDREDHLGAAREALAQLPRSRMLASSAVEETAPIGPADQGAYLNQMVAVETTMEPHALLDALQAIEQSRGRERIVRWGARTLDLDIVAFDRQRVCDERLTVPHPELRARDFWQRELDEVRAAAIELPDWACVKRSRVQHIARVVAVLMEWAGALGLDDEDARAWRDAGRWHDALRDADESELRALVPDGGEWPEVLHGPAAAARLEAAGETRRSVLDAIRYHTVGYPAWDRVGRALYMADFLEPGRKFARTDRAFLARQVPRDFDGVFRQVVRERIEWTIREGKGLFPETVALWNAFR